MCSRVIDMTTLIKGSLMTCPFCILPSKRVISRISRSHAEVQQCKLRSVNSRFDETENELKRIDML